MTAAIEPIAGRYLHLALEGQPHRLYFEEAGQGIPLLCLHTAGADGRQFRALLNDPEITADYRVIAFDMPWHGKSSPPEGWQREDYQLTTERYTGMILAVADALELERPVAMGCSIGGRIVLNLAWAHPERFRALIGLQSAAYVERYYDAGWLNHPEAHKWETVWHYMQGGPGIFQGDLFFYQVEGDVRDRIRDIDTAKCPLYMLTGEYDYSASPADSEAAAALIPGAKLTIMKGLGHFPMSENPEGFRGYLLPVLEEIRSAG